MSAPTFTPGRHRSFVHLSRAWYGRTALRDDRVVDEVSITLGGKEREGVDYELCVKWVVLGDRAPASPQLRAFDDAWLAFSELADVFAWMATKHGSTIQPAEFCEALLALGFEDYTEEHQS